MDEDQQLYDFIWNNIAPYVIPIPLNLKEDDPQYQEYLGKYQVLITQNFPIWKKAFTHKSIDANDNYELLELVGDVAQKLMFYRIIIPKYPALTEGQLTVLENFYLSTQSQAKIGIRLGFPDYIHSLIPINDATIEDVFEAVFGALYEIGNQSFENMGCEFCFNYMNYIIENSHEELDEAILKGENPITQVKNRFDVLGLTTPGKGLEDFEESSREGYQAKFIVKLPPVAQKVLIGIGIPQDEVSKPLALVLAKDKKSAKMEAYAIALKKLVDLGIDDDYIEQVRKSKIPYFNEAINKAKSEGWDDINYDVSEKFKIPYLRLYAIKTLPDGSKQYQNLRMAKLINVQVLSALQATLRDYIQTGLSDQLLEYR